MSTGKRPKLSSKSSSSLSLGKHKPLTKKPIMRRMSKQRSAKSDTKESDETERIYLTPDDVMRSPIFPIVEGLLPPELDYARAKAFLMKSSSVTNISLYDHLVELLRRIFRQQPRNAVDLFETISYEMKYDRLEALSNKNGFAALPCDTLEVSKIHMEMFKNLDSEMWKPKNERRSTALVLPKDLIDVVQNIKIQTSFKPYLSLLRDYSIGISQEEFYCIYSSLTLFTKTKPVEEIRFWGKIYGIFRDYYIAEAPYKVNAHWDEIETGILLGDEALDIDFSLDTPQQNNLFQGSENANLNNEILNMLRLKPSTFVPAENPGVGVNQFIYFACNKLGKPWIKLPHVTPEQLSAAKLIKKTFTGVFDAPVISYPPFPGKEIHLLRAQVARISAGTMVSPAGYYRVSDEKLGPSGVSHSLEKVEEFEGLALHELETPDLQSWVHHRYHILPQGRCTWMRPRKETEAPFEEFEEESTLAEELTGPTFEEPSGPEIVEEQSKPEGGEEKSKPEEAEEKSKQEDVEEKSKSEKSGKPEEAEEPIKQEEGEEPSKPEEEETSKPEEAEELSNAEAAEELSKAEEAEELSRAEEAEELSKAEEAEEISKAEEAEELSKAEETEEQSKLEAAEPSKPEDAEAQDKPEEDKSQKVEEESKSKKVEEEQSKEEEVKSKGSRRSKKTEDIEVKSKTKDVEEQSKQEELEEKSKHEEVQSRSAKSVKIKIKKEKREADEEEFLGADEVTRSPPLMTLLSEDFVAEGVQPWIIISSSRLLPQHSTVVLKSNLWPGAHTFLDGKLLENVYVGFGVKQDGIQFSPQLPPFPASQYPSNCVVEMADPLPEDDVEYQKYLRAQRAIARKKLREEKYGKERKKKSKKKKKKKAKEEVPDEETGPGKEEVLFDELLSQGKETSVQSEARSGHESEHEEEEEKKRVEEEAQEEEGGAFEDNFLMDFGLGGDDINDDLGGGFLEEETNVKGPALSEEESESEPD